MNPLEGSSNFDFRFEDLLDDSQELNSKGITKTKFFAKIDNFESNQIDPLEFYDERTFVKLKEENLPSSEKIVTEKIVTAILLQKEGKRDIFLTRQDIAEQLNPRNELEPRNEQDPREIRIHQETDEGREIVTTLNSREITVVALTDEQYARIHSSAMESLLLLAQQQKDVKNEEKTKIQIKKLATRNIKQKIPNKNDKKTQEQLTRQTANFAQDNKKIQHQLELIAENDKKTQENKTKALDMKSKQNVQAKQSKDEHNQIKKEHSKQQ